jgi:hypothetical protein
MRLTQQVQSTDRNKTYALSHLSAIVAVVLLPPLLYFLSAAPVIKLATNTEGIVSPKMVRRIYRPLFYRAPDATQSYVKLCGITDIELFFVMQCPQGETG